MAVESDAGSQAGDAASQQGKSADGTENEKSKSPNGSKDGSGAVSLKSDSEGGTPRSEKEDPIMDTRNMRRIIAEDPEWSLATVPLLTDLCVNHVIKNFEFNSKILNELLPKHKCKVLEKIDPKLPLKVTALLVEDEGFWQRSCRSAWDICDVSKHGGLWKRMYFERYLQKIIELYVPEQTEPTELNEFLPLASNYVQRLEVRQLLPPVKETKVIDDDMSDAGSESGDAPEIDHFDFNTILQRLPYLQEFRVTYSVRDCGMNFEWNLFTFTARDCLLLSKAVAACKHLKIFQLHSSNVDDDKCRVFISHILDHPNLVELDLSHNSIGDRGARALGKFLNNHSKLSKLIVCDNLIRSAGAMAIAHALTKNTTLNMLDIRLNRLGDEGGQAVGRALLRNNTLTELNLSSNDLTEPSAAVLSQVVEQNKTLLSLDLSCNRLGTDGGKQLQEGMERNTTITVMDLRLTDCGQETEYFINQILSGNQDKARQNQRCPSGMM